MQVGTLMPERSHKYFELKLWASENAAIGAHVNLNMSRKTFGGWGFAPDPDWGLISPQRRGQRLRATEALETRAPMRVVNSLQNQVNSITLRGRRQRDGRAQLSPVP